MEKETVIPTENIIEVNLLVDKKIIMETLQRIGIANKREKVLYPSCYLYQKDGKNYIVHFKQLFMLEREKAYNNICEDDYLRRNAIIFCLKKWKMISIKDESLISPFNKFVFVLPFKEKNNWKIEHKYNINSINKIEDKPNFNEQTNLKVN